VLRPEFVERKLQLIVDDLGQLLAFRDTPYGDLVADPIRLAAVERIVSGWCSAPSTSTSI
jgi:hypothetical protein